MEQRRRRGLAILGVLALVIVMTTIGVVTAKDRSSSQSTTTSSTAPVTTTSPYAGIENSKVSAARSAVNVELPSTPGRAAPVLPQDAYKVPLGSREVVGFVPYYELTRLAGESFGGFTYLVYSNINLRRDGSLDESAASGGWDSLVNGGAAALVSVGHAAGDRVLLSIFADTESVIGPLCAGGERTGAEVAGEIASLLPSYGFDGVDIDVEGLDTGDRGGFVNFVRGFSKRLKAANPSFALMVNTYPQSAEDPTSFFDPQAMSTYVNDFFVMGYDMDSNEIASANAPLTGTSPSDAEALATYAAAGLASMTILGVPFYGYDFPCEGATPGSATTGSPYAVTYSEIATSFLVNHHRPLWDPITDTPYTAFKRVGNWHQTWFDDPTSIALKVALASEFGVAGVGAWELGMVEGHPQMLSVLDGGSPPRKLPLAHQPA